MPRGGRREKAGRKSGWVNSETQLIRVPKILANRLLEIAKYLDQGNEIHLIEKQIEPEQPISSEMMELETLVAQLSIFPTEQGNELDLLPQDDRGELESLPQSLTGRALARRLDVSSGTLSRYKNTTAKTLDWMLKKDKKWGWFYSHRDEKYYPIHPSEFDHLLSELNNEENYEDF